MTGEENKGNIVFKKILMATDFSDYATHALEYAEVLAKQFEAEILLLHVIESFTYSLTDSMTVIGHDQALSATAEALLENLQNRLLAEGFSVEHVLTHGTAYKEIVGKAKTMASDLIVIGSHGRTGMEQLLLGSVAEKVVRLADCPVLTIPAKR